MDKLKIEYIPIGKITPYARNARRHTEDDVDKLKASIQAFGFRDALGVWGPKNIVVEGHGRLMAAKELGFTELPCVHMDDMTDEERKAYALAHNKTAENSSWEPELLQAELLDIDKFDMTEFGFQLPEEEDEEEEDEGYYGDERERTYSAYNLKDYDSARVAGPYDLPVLRKCSFVPEDLIGFNYMLTDTEHDKGIHFFLDDYQFERVWSDPMTYISKFTEFPCVLTPDFSLYTDMPMAMKIWNVYRSRLIGQMAADCGCKVIPTLQWAGPETLDWVFEGIEKGGTVAVSTVGVMKDKDALALWRCGMERALVEVEPETVICYGTEIDFDFSPAKMVLIRSRGFVEK